MSKKVWKGFMLVMGMVWALCLGVKTEAATVAEARSFTAESWFVFDKTTGVVTGYTGMDTTVVVPSTIQGVAVKGISGTFKGNETLEMVVIPNTITTIGDETFYGCTRFHNLATYTPSVSLDASVEVNSWELNQYAYDTANAKGYLLTNAESGTVTIPASVNSIGKRAFGEYTAVSKFVVVDGNATYYTTEDGVCLLMKSVEVDGTVRVHLVRLATGKNLDSGYTLPDGLYSIGQYAMEKVHINGSLVFPKTLEVISDYGFYQYGNINNSFVFPEDGLLHTIGSYAFASNPILQIKLPKSLKVIGAYLCIDSQNVAIDISETQIETIPAYAFMNCSALHKITMPVTVKHIEAYAFAGCNNLDTVIFLGDELLTLGEGAFKDSPTLHTIDIPEGVTNIENDTFSGCSNLAEIILPDSVEVIGDNAFKDCVTIEVLVIPPNVTYISNTSFEGANQTKIDTSKNTYAQTKIKGELPKKNYKKTIGNLKYKVTKSHQTKGTVMVYGVKSRKKKTITIPSTVNINGYTFKVTSIGTKAFYNNKKLTKVTIGSNVTTIGKKAFYKCKKLKTIVVKSSKVKSVKSQAFKGIHKKAKIKLPKMSAKKFKKYKKKFANKGQAKTVKITK